MSTIHKILIANRGEIACRIIRTCRQMGIATVAVYSDPDADAKFVREADDAIGLGGITSSESYLDIQKIIKAAKESSADAIHPGYGFLSENTDFSKAVTDAGLIFIGPKPETIVQMGSKIESKNIMKKAGVPVIPGYQGDNQSIDHLIKEAEKIGYPLMVKASAGGGGKGLKRVIKKSELKEAITSAKREAKSSFGDDTVLIEKYIESPRHIEMQIFGDHKGHVIHLFERECTLQRRHQKVIEEAPSSVINEKLRKKLGEAAIKAAKTVDYVGAGTVEFVMDQKGHFYFLEMNTRLQVEHPVTEFITGLDLVKMQIEVAQGQALSVKQSQVKINGHAMEARVYAEDPENGFLPASGTIEYLKLLHSDDVRYDFGFDSGDEINVYYDPMIGKIIAHAGTREDCIHKLSWALKETTILGTITNLWFLDNLINHPSHVSGDMDTHFIDEHLDEVLKQTDFDNNHYLIAASVYFLLSSQNGSQLPLMSQLTGFRISPTQWIDSIMVCHDQEYVLKYRVLDHQQKKYEYKIDDQVLKIQVNHLKDHDLSLTIDNHHLEITFASLAKTIYLKTGKGSLKIQQSTGVQDTQEHVPEGSLSAPLPGKVLKIMVKANQQVSSGDTLMIVEAMKMEHPIKAQFDGKVDVIHYHENDTVKLGDVLLEISGQ